MNDYDCMMECSRRPCDHFLVTSERSIDHLVMTRFTKNVLACRELESLGEMGSVYPLGSWEYDSEPVGGIRNRTLQAMSFKDFRDRFSLAIVGAALLLGPMWLVVLHNTLYTGLITTTVCVAVFELLVVFQLDKPMDVLSATAAYAAVLVVHLCGVDY